MSGFDDGLARGCLSDGSPLEGKGGSGYWSEPEPRVEGAWGVSVYKGELKVGLQVAYIPPYVHDRNKTTQDALKDVDTEFGFVTSWNEDAVFVRYWIKRWPGELRNVANAEGCDYDLLYKCGAVPQYIVDDLIDAMRANPKYYGWYREGQWDLKERNDD